MLQTLNQLQKHTRRVLITKRTLPVFAFLLAALIIVWPLFKDQKDSFSLGVSTSNPTKGAKMDMENLRFFGLNTKKLPMTLTTPIVKEIDPTTHQLRMEKPVATYQMANQEVLTAQTPYALIFQENETVLFEDKIKITSASGYKANTSKVLCDYTQGTADSDEKIAIKGPAGTLDAKGLWMADKGNLILFKKQVKATIYQKNEQIKLSSQEGVQIDQIKKTLTTLGKATVYHQGNVLEADKMIAYYTNDKKNQVEKVVALGNVSINNGKQKMTGDTGTYTPASKQILMEGNVVLSQGNNKVKGDKATLNLKTGESDLKAAGRIKGQLIPTQLRGDKK
ncbi:MAG: LPS export ABC transporter periplasmic protein LptC [Alphaproteobacteria bacterium]